MKLLWLFMGNNTIDVTSYCSVGTILYRGSGRFTSHTTHSNFPFFLIKNDRYHLGISWRSSNLTVSCRQFYTYLFIVRDGSFNPLHPARTLFSQLAVDACTKMESERYWLKQTKMRLRSDSYIPLQEGIRNDVDSENPSKVCILPSTFTGIPRYMNKRTHARRHDLCSSLWPTRPFRHFHLQSEVDWSYQRITSGTMSIRQT